MEQMAAMDDFEAALRSVLLILVPPLGGGG